MQLPKTTLGKTGLKVSNFGLGGFHQLEITSDIVAEVIDTYLSVGGNYIETATGYGSGDSEDKIGRALAGRSEDVILASKSGAATSDDIRRDLENSLKRLRRDRLDFYFFHGATPEKVDQITAPGGAVDGLQKCIDEGILGGMGLSSHVPVTYLKALDQINLSVILIWCNYLDNLNFPILTGEIIPKARTLGVGVTGMKPLADGLLYKSVTPAVRYALSQGLDVAVSGTNSPQQVLEVAEAACQGAADENLQNEILKIAPELGKYVCRRCGNCGDKLMRLFELEGRFDRQMMDFLPRNPAEHALRRALSGWFGRADEAKEFFKEEKFDLAELKSTAGEIECPYDIDIPRKLSLSWAKLSDGRPGLV